MKQRFIKNTNHMFDGGDEVPMGMPQDVVDKWLREGRIEAVVKKATPDIEKKIEEIIGDLKDDGKLNYSNNPKKKSPGRKPKKKKGFFSKG